MKMTEYFLLPLIMAAMLALPGCETPAFTMKSGEPAATEATGAPSTTTLGPSFEQAGSIPADKTVVYIYRPASLGGPPVPFGVRVKGKSITTMVKGGYYAYVTEPGQIEFTVFEVGFGAPSSTSSITVNAKGGQAIYLRGSHGSGLMGRGRLELVSPQVGAKEIVNCKAVTTTQ